MQKAHNSDLQELANAPLRTVSKSSFAQLMNVSPGRVSQMIRAGLPVEHNGKIDVARGKLWIAENVSPTRSNSQARGVDLFGEEKRKVSLNDERSRLAKEQADAAAMRNAVARSELVKAGDVEREWAEILRKVRAGVLAVTSRVRQHLPHLTAHDAAVIDAELRRVLEDLANDE